jgi:hypothetical protein
MRERPQEIDFRVSRRVRAPHNKRPAKVAGLFDYSGSGGAAFETSSHAAGLLENQRVAKPAWSKPRQSSFWRTQP